MPEERIVHINFVSTEQDYRELSWALSQGKVYYDTGHGQMQLQVKAAQSCEDRIDRNGSAT